MSSLDDPPNAQSIRRDARWLAQGLDAQSGTFGLVEMSTADYRSASFLDDRLFEQPRKRFNLPVTDVAAAMAGARADARWIFHIGHVGSTLIARLLGELEMVLALREPRLLRDLLAIAPEQRAGLAPTVRELCSRSFTVDEAALVKATSFVSEIIPELAGAEGRALFLTASPRNYIASILAGENSSMELEALAPTRAALIARRAGPLPPLRTLADLAAIGWACGVTALEAAAEARPDLKIHWCDFDRFLADTPGHLSAIAEKLALPAAPAEVGMLAVSPLLKRYSKAPEFAYSAALRGELIADATRQLGGEIDSAVEMLDRLGQGSPLLRRALDRHEEA